MRVDIQESPLNASLCLNKCVWYFLSVCWFQIFAVVFGSLTIYGSKWEITRLNKTKSDREKNGTIFEISDPNLYRNSSQNACN